jgi:riboflavin kinase/FMN adenylyltransferase
MKVFRHLESLQRHDRPIALALGFFDGVHAGHQQVLDAACRAARDAGGEPWALTFDVHPRGVLGMAPPPLLTCNKHKLMLMKRYGMQGCILLPFTPRFAATPANTFLDALGRHLSTLCALAVGENWRFGRGGEGDGALLSDWAAHRGLVVSIAPCVAVSDHPVSSTRIRAAVAAGALDEAAAMLRRPFSVLGTVVHGYGVGRALGFPTANLDCDNEVMPPTGVYAVLAALDNAVFEGVLSFGSRPTLDGDPTKPRLELHIPGMDRDLYGRDVEVFILRALRAQCRFASRAELRKAIEDDVAAAARIPDLINRKDWLYRHCYSVL